MFYGKEGISIHPCRTCRRWKEESSRQRDGMINDVKKGQCGIHKELLIFVRLEDDGGGWWESRAGRTARTKKLSSLG